MPDEPDLNANLRAVVAMLGASDADARLLLNEFADREDELLATLSFLASFLLTIIAELRGEPRENVVRDLLLMLAGGDPTTDADGL